MQTHATKHPNDTILSMNTKPSTVVLLVPSQTSQKIAIAKELRESLHAQYVYKGVTVSHGIFFLVLLQETKDENAMINICEQMGWSFDKILVITEANCLNGDILNRITDGKKESDDGAFVPHSVLSTLLLKMTEKMLSMMRETGRKMSEGMKRAHADITVLEERLEGCRMVISMLQSALSQMVEERALETADIAPIWFSPPREQLAVGEVSMVLEIADLKEEVKTLKRERAEEREYCDQKEIIQGMDFNAHMNKTCAAYEEEIRKLKEDALSPSVKELTKAIEYIDRKHQIMDEVCLICVCVCVCVCVNQSIADLYCCRRTCAKKMKNFALCSESFTRPNTGIMKRSTK